MMKEFTYDTAEEMVRVGDMVRIAAGVLDPGLSDRGVVKYIENRDGLDIVHVRVTGRRGPTRIEPVNNSHITKIRDSKPQL